MFWRLRHEAFSRAWAGEAIERAYYSEALPSLHEVLTRFLGEENAAGDGDRDDVAKINAWRMTYAAWLRGGGTDG